MLNENSLEAKLFRAFQFMRKAVFKPKRNITGLKQSEVMLLFCIKKKAPHTKELKVSEISKFLEVTPPTVTQLVRGLENQKIVERRLTDSDRRAVFIKLTAKGEEIILKSEEEFLMRLREIVEYLGEKDSVKLTELLVKVANYHHQKNNMKE
jgi:DNA-binding MarR family transcriptional regulator